MGDQDRVTYFSLPLNQTAILHDLAFWSQLFCRISCWAVWCVAWLHSIAIDPPCRSRMNLTRTYEPNCLGATAQACHGDRHKHASISSSAFAYLMPFSEPFGSWKTFWETASSSSASGTTSSALPAVSYASTAPSSSRPNPWPRCTTWETKSWPTNLTSGLCRSILLDLASFPRPTFPKDPFTSPLSASSKTFRSVLCLWRAPRPHLKGQVPKRRSRVIFYCHAPEVV